MSVDIFDHLVHSQVPQELQPGLPHTWNEPKYLQMLPPRLSNSRKLLCGLGVSQVVAEPVAQFLLQSFLPPE